MDHAPMSTQVTMQKSIAYRYISLAAKQFTNTTGRMCLYALRADPKSVHEKWFGPRDTLMPVVNWANEWNLKGFNIYMSWSLYKTDSRTKANMIASAAYVADWDDGPPKKIDGLTPTLVVETSIGRRQQIYVHDPAPLGDVDDAYKALTKKFECDAISSDPVHLWRVPGSMNWLNPKKIAAGREPCWAKWDGKTGRIVDVVKYAPGVAKKDTTPDAGDDGEWPRRRKGKPLSHLIRRWLRDKMRPDDDKSTHIHKVVLSLCELGWGIEDIMEKLEGAPCMVGREKRLEEMVLLSIGKYDGEVPRASAKDGGHTGDEPTSFEEAVHRLAPGDKEEEITYLWKPYLPRKEVTLMDGSSSAGKTSVMLRISKALIDGEKMPNDVRIRGGHHVLYISTESDYTRVTLPKLNRMALVGTTFWHHQDPRWCIDEEGLDELDAFMGKHDIDMVVIDNLVDYLMTDGKTETMNSYSFSSQTMLKMSSLAKKHNAAIVAVRHMGKGAKNNLMDRGMGSVGWGKGCRSMIQVDRLLQDEDDVDEQYVFTHAKGQHSKRGPKIEYKIGGILLAGGVLDDVGIATWVGLSDVEDSELMGAKVDAATKHAKSEAREDAKKWLRELLTGKGPVDVAIIKDRSESRSISASMLQRAASDLGVVKHLGHEKGKRGATSSWELIGDD
jgi:hypothetical protein